jgi:hypothetical protein
MWNISAISTVSPTLTSRKLPDMTQSIIVYRNPIEAAFWEGDGAAMLVPVGLGVIVFFVVFLTLNALVVERYTGWNSKYRSYGAYSALAVSALAGFVAARMMWI